MQPAPASEPTQAFVTPVGGIGVLTSTLPQQTVTAARAATTATTPSLFNALGVISRLAGLAFNLLWPSLIGVNPNVRQKRPVGETSRYASSDTATTLAEVVVTAPQVQRVGKSTSVDYFADLYDVDLDLTSNLTLEPTPWTDLATQFPSPSPSPSPTPQTPTRTLPAPLPQPSTKPSARPSPRPSTRRSPKPREKSPTPSPLFSPFTSSPLGGLSLTPTPLKTPTFPAPQPTSRPGVVTNPLTAPQPTPLDAPQESGRCVCPKEKKKTKTEEDEDRTICYVKLVKERKRSANDTTRKWRKIKCQ